MQPTLERVANLVAGYPAPAMPLPVLTELLERDRPGSCPDRDTLLAWVRHRPDLLRIIDPWRGPWRSLEGDGHTGTVAYDAVLEDVCCVRHPWLVAAPGVGGNDGDVGPRRSMALLRQSVVALSLAVDDASVTSLTRWCRLIVEDRAIRTRLARMPPRFRVTG